MGGGEYLDILILAMVAAFIIFRLRSVLGRRTGHERRPTTDPFARPSEAEHGKDNVIALPDRDASGEGATASPAEKRELTPVETGINEIRAADRSFEPETFVAGGKAAFEMIVTSFAKGDLSSVKPFLAKDVYENFSEAIDERLKAKESLETTVVGFTSAQITDARLDGRNAVVTVKFVTEQVNVTRDRDGKVVEGDPQKPVEVTDIWTFARDTRSRDPNWSLIETGTPA